MMKKKKTSDNSSMKVQNVELIFQFNTPSWLNHPLLRENRNIQFTPSRGVKIIDRFGVRPNTDTV